MNRFGTDQSPRNIAVVGTGISGMAAAWLLSQHHRVTVYEKDDRIGGHTNTVTLDGPAGPVNVDTGFIVYNDRNYPNLVALFDHLGVATRPTEMSFAASLDGGRFEYSGEGLSGLLAQPVNALRPRMWRLLGDLLRFYREAPKALDDPGATDLTLGAYLSAHGYGAPFVRDHLLPMGAAIWSTPAQEILDYPLAAFVRFCDNHGLLSLGERPQWRTVVGGSRAYVERLTAPFANRIRLNTGVTAIYRGRQGVRIEDRQGGARDYDDVVIASHADQALDLLADADPAERRLLGAFRY
jgi:predicted NAD/FAD-binding protein